MSEPCDNCGRDLSVIKGKTPGSPIGTDWRLKVCAEEIPFPLEAHATVDYFMEPPLKEPLYFCGLGCLGKWQEKQ